MKKLPKVWKNFQWNKIDWLYLKIKKKICLFEILLPVQNSTFCVNYKTVLLRATSLPLLLIVIEKLFFKNLLLLENKKNYYSNLINCLKIFTLNLTLLLKKRKLLLLLTFRYFPLQNVTLNFPITYLLFHCSDIIFKVIKSLVYYTPYLSPYH